MSEIPASPQTRTETYLAGALGQQVVLPEPVTRLEQYLKAIAESGGGGGGGLMPVIIYAESHTTVETYEVPVLTDAQITAAYNGIMAGKVVVVVDDLDTIAMQVFDASNIDGTAIRLIFTDKMILNYKEGGEIEATPFAGGTAPVASVNSKTGVVVLNASDILAQNNQSIQNNLERIDNELAIRQVTITIEEWPETLTDDFLYRIETTITHGGKTYDAGLYQVADDDLVKFSAMQLLPSTGQSTTAGMTQKAITDALAGIEDVQDYVIKGAGAPTTSTVGTVGKLYEDTTNGKLYQCTAVSGSTYTWEAVGGGSSINVVQSTGTSTTDVMSQKATTDMVYFDKAFGMVRIGSTAAQSGSDSVSIGTGSYSTGGLGCVAIGRTAKAKAAYGIAIGDSNVDSAAANAVSIGDHSEVLSYGAVSLGPVAKIPSNANGSIALGMFSGSSITSPGMMDIGSSNTSYGYNNTNYRLLTGVHDSINAHDAVNKQQLDAALAQITALEARIAALEGNA